MKRSSLLILLCIWMASAGLTIPAFGQPEVSFSRERGFYYQGFDLVISSEPADGQIMYTLDGSDPRFTQEAYTSSSPVSLFISPYSVNGRAVTPGVIVRACAVTNLDTSRVETHSYIFPAEVKYQQETSPVLAPYWPTTTYNPTTYPDNLLIWMRTDFQQIFLRVEPSVVHKPEYYSSFEMALMDIPTFSLVTDPQNLFDDSTGIYINATWPGREWERPGSLELIDPDEDGFQVNTGIRIRGGWSCRGDFAKHAFRLFFREEYGDAKLNYPLFDDYGTDAFDKIDLRCSQNNSWHVPGSSSRADFIRDLYARTTQGDMGQPYTRSEYYHLFVNGNYWGLFQTQERPEARYAASYFGGDKDDYDVVKSTGPSTDAPPYTLEATDGDLNSSAELFTLSQEGFDHDNYFRARGMNPDGSPNPDYPVLLDEDNLIDYIIIIFFIGNHDGPAPLSSSDRRINNFFGIYNRTDPDGFKYFMHDAESSLASLNDDITTLPVVAGDSLQSFNPMSLHRKLMENEDYRQAFTDRAYLHLHGDGVLTASRCVARYNSLRNKINQAVIGESARWGYIWPARAYAKIEDWDPAVNAFIDRYFPQRTEIVIGQFTAAGWLNEMAPPALEESDFEIGEEGELVLLNTSYSIQNPNSSGEIYYTVNGTDPRASGGELAAEALLYSGPVSPSVTHFLKARVKDGDSWSPLTEQVIMRNGGEGILISELNYNPRDEVVGSDTLLSKKLEFIEIKNHSGLDLDLSGYRLTGGVQYTFPMNVSLENDSLSVVASDTTAFRKLYGFKAFGPYKGSQSNGGENIRLLNAGGGQVTEIFYNHDGVWYYPADGGGYTLVYSDYDHVQTAMDKPAWRVSTALLGSPGKDDPLAVSSEIRITEVLANSAYPQVDAIELYNPGESAVDIGNWFLSDEKDTPGKWQIPAGNIIPSNGYLMFCEGHYVADTLQYTADEFGSAFSLSSGGERIYLYSGAPGGEVLEFVTDFDIKATETNVSFGDYTPASGKVQQVQLETLTTAAKNGTYRKSPLVFTAIMYHPMGDNPEYLILRNRSDSVVNLFHSIDTAKTWRIDGIGFSFPPRVSVPPGDSLYLVEKRVSTDEFVQMAHLDPSVPVFNYSGKLSNSTEKLAIERPVRTGTDTVVQYAWVTLESVSYEDQAPWPALADGDGYALQRIETEAFADDAANWTARYNAVPDAHAGNNQRVRVGTTVQLVGLESQDYNNQSLNYYWQLISRPEGSMAELSDINSVTPEFTADEAGEYDFSLRVDNGQHSSAYAYVSVLAYENHPPVADINPATHRVTLPEKATIVANWCYDPDYDVLDYAWELAEIPDGSTYTTELYTGRILEFTPDVVGTFTFKLSVGDGENSSAAVNVRLIASAPDRTDPEILTSGIMIYPNPVVSELNVDFSLKEASDMQMTLMTLEGRVIREEVFKDLTPGNNHLTISLVNQDFTGGLYLLRIKTDEFHEVRKLMILR